MSSNQTCSKCKRGSTFMMWGPDYDSTLSGSFVHFCRVHAPPMSTITQKRLFELLDIEKKYLALTEATS